MCGSQRHSTCPGCTVCPSSTSSSEPLGTPKSSRVIPLGPMTWTRPLRARAIRCPFSLVTAVRRSNLTVPVFLALTSLSSTERLATPPMWKVRMVSWVPGSPIDWAAMMPTAMPSSTMAPVARSMP